MPRSLRILGREKTITCQYMIFVVSSAVTYCAKSSMRLPIPLYGKSKTDNINAQKAKLVSQIFCANVPNMLCFTAQYMHTLLFCSCCTMYMRIHCTGIFPRASQLKVCPGCGIRQDCDRIGCFGRYRRYSFRIALRHSSAYKIRPETARWV